MRLFLYCLLIALISSIIFFGVSYFINNDRVAIRKTAFTFPGFFIVYYVVVYVIDFLLPGSMKKEDDGDEIRDVDYVFPQVGNDEDRET